MVTIPMCCQLGSKSSNIVCSKLKGLLTSTSRLCFQTPAPLYVYLQGVSDITYIALTVIVMKPEMKTTFCKIAILLLFTAFVILNCIFFRAVPCKTLSSLLFYQKSDIYFSTVPFLRNNTPKIQRLWLL
jgi:hypothetical protein